VVNDVYAQASPPLSRRPVTLIDVVASARWPDTTDRAPLDCTTTVRPCHCHRLSPCGQAYWSFAIVITQPSPAAISHHIAAEERRRGQGAYNRLPWA
jgi:hypothetical protein